MWQYLFKAFIPHSSFRKARRMSYGSIKTTQLLPWGLQCKYSMHKIKGKWDGEERRKEANSHAKLLILQGSNYDKLWWKGLQGLDSQGPHTLLGNTQKLQSRVNPCFTLDHPFTLCGPQVNPAIIRSSGTLRQTWENWNPQYDAITNLFFSSTVIWCPGKITTGTISTCGTTAGSPRLMEHIFKVEKGN